jgi:hypothetical protein
VADSGSSRSADLMRRMIMRDRVDLPFPSHLLTAHERARASLNGSRCCDDRNATGEVDDDDEKGKESRERHQGLGEDCARGPGKSQ